MPAALQSVVGSDPALRAAVQKQFDAATNPQALQDAFGAKDGNGKPVSTTDALASFEQMPTVYAQILDMGLTRFRGRSVDLFG